jgi:hypothetical protein
MATEREIKDHKCSPPKNEVYLPRSFYSLAQEGVTFSIVRVFRRFRILRIKRKEEQ